MVTLIIISCQACHLDLAQTTRKKNFIGIIIYSPQNLLNNHVWKNLTNKSEEEK
jgi:hypothetical protein